MPSWLAELIPHLGFVFGKILLKLGLKILF